MNKIDRSEITPEHLFLSRRKFIKGMGAALASAALVGGAATACAPQPGPVSATPAPPSTVAPSIPDPLAEMTTTPAPAGPVGPGTQVVWPPVSTDQDDLGDPLTTETAINSYNNYYEFSFDKEDARVLARRFKADPWAVEVGGLVDRPTTFSMADLLGFPQEEHIYRMRCVEAWSMVIPWIGFPLRTLLEAASPQPEAKFVRLETVYRPTEMPGQKGGGMPWPYVEGLRLDEAMHDLTLLATGLYGKALKGQAGAPVRLVVPWKYGFKSIKSVVKIELVAEMPTSTWMQLAPREYGFYANVNPDVDHPRWSQATERRIGETKRRKTLLFNGYEEEVAGLYEGMDLKTWF